VSSSLAGLAEGERCPGKVLIRFRDLSAAAERLGQRERLGRVAMGATGVALQNENLGEPA
jgi:hypothetical protein